MAINYWVSYPFWSLIHSERQVEVGAHIVADAHSHSEINIVSSGTEGHRVVTGRAHTALGPSEALSHRATTRGQVWCQGLEPRKVSKIVCQIAVKFDWWHRCQHACQISTEWLNDLWKCFPGAPFTNMD